MTTPNPEKPAPVSLVRKATTPAPDAPSTTPLPTGELTTVARPFPAVAPLTPFEAFARWVTQPFIYVPATIGCLAFLSWSLLIRLPDRSMIVKASEPIRMAEASASPGVQLDALQDALNAAVFRTLTNADQLPLLISDMEQKARSAGFVTELTTASLTPAVPGIPELLRHPIQVRLGNDYDRNEPAYDRLIDWMREISSQRCRAEFTAASLQSLGDGLTDAIIELNVLSLNHHAKAASE